MSIDLADGIRVTVRQPQIPRWVVTPPTTPRTILVPVRGPQGPAGSGGGATYVYTQSAPAATWTIPHNLGRRAPVLLFEAGDPDEPVFTDITYPDDNTIVVEWPAPTTGTAHI